MCPNRPTLLDNLLGMGVSCMVDSELKDSGILCHHVLADGSPGTAGIATHLRTLLSTTPKRPTVLGNRLGMGVSCMVDSELKDSGMRCHHVLAGGSPGTAGIATHLRNVASTSPIRSNAHCNVLGKGCLVSHS